MLPIRSSVLRGGGGCGHGGGGRARAGARATQFALARATELQLSLPAAIVHPQPVERVGDRDLARQARVLVAVVASCRAGRSRPRSSAAACRMNAGIDVDVAGGAAAAAAAQRQQLVEAVVADHFHHRQARPAPRPRVSSPERVDDDQLAASVQSFLVGACPRFGAAASRWPRVWQAERSGRMGLSAEADRDRARRGRRARAGDRRGAGRAPAIPSRASASAATRPCCARSSASRSASPPRPRCGTSWRRCSGADVPPEALLAAEFDALRACGLSRQKQGYARSLCELVASGALDLDRAARGRRGGDRRSSPGSRASAAGRPRSTCCSPKAAPTSGPPATSRCRPGSHKHPRPAGAARPRRQPRALAEAWRPHRGAVGDLHLALLQQPGAVARWPAATRVGGTAGKPARCSAGYPAYSGAQHATRHPSRAIHRRASAVGLRRPRQACGRARHGPRSRAAAAGPLAAADDQDRRGRALASGRDPCGRTRTFRGRLRAGASIIPAGSTCCRTATCSSPRPTRPSGPRTTAASRACSSRISRRRRAARCPAPTASPCCATPTATALPRRAPRLLGGLNSPVRHGTRRRHALRRRHRRGAALSLCDGHHAHHRHPAPGGRAAGRAAQSSLDQGPRRHARRLAALCGDRLEQQRRRARPRRGGRAARRSGRSTRHGRAPPLRLPACATRSAWRSNRAAERCGRWSTSATSSAATSFPIT